MSRWHAVRIRDDLYRQIQAQAVADARSIAQMTDRLLSGALEQGTNTPASSDGGPSREVIPGESERGAKVGEHTGLASSPARAPVAQRQIEGQTTADEMLASCPQCAGAFEIAVNGNRFCKECGYVREPERT